ncbi:unnamed protein product, partial [Ectocarpus fasciculatus]
PNPLSLPCVFLASGEKTRASTSTRRNRSKETHARAQRRRGNLTACIANDPRRR